MLREKSSRVQNHMASRIPISTNAYIENNSEGKKYEQWL
jgi:DNA-binding XRE family transcriptional regulator